jgi:hypothetical protein
MKKRGIPSPNLADAFLLTLEMDAQKPRVDDTPHWMKTRRSRAGTGYVA